MSKSCRNKKAFSLVELIVTIGILSVGVVSVSRALAFCAGMAGLSNDIIDGVFLAEDKAQELEFKEGNKLINKEPASAQDIKDKFLWKYSLNLDPAMNLYKMDLNITWQRTARTEKIEFMTYLKK